MRNFKIQLVIICSIIFLLVSCEKNEPSTPENEPPKAVVTASTTEPQIGESVELDGTGSSDPDGDNLIFNWSLSAPESSNATLSDISIPNPSFTVDKEGEYIATLRVSDGQLEAGGELTVVATPCQPLVIDSDITTAQSFPDVCLDTTQFDYIVSGLIDIDAEVILEPGIRIGFEEDAGFRINDGAALLALGTQEDSIIMTGIEETDGFWKGILFRADDVTSELKYVEIHYAGSEAFAGFDVAAAISVDNDAKLDMSFTTITDIESYALSLNPRAELVNFQYNSIQWWTGYNSSDLIANVPDKQMGSFDTDSKYGGIIRVYPTASGMDKDMTIKNIRLKGTYIVDFQMAGLFEVNAAVTIDGDVNLAFDEDAGLRVNDGGSIHAKGIAEDHVFFQTSAGFDSWRGILFRADDRTSELNFVVIQGGGSEAWPGILEPANISVEQDASVSITNSYIQKSKGWGVWLDSEEIVFEDENTKYSDNAKGAIGQRD